MGASGGRVPQQAPVEAVSPVPLRRSALTEAAGTAPSIAAAVTGRGGTALQPGLRSDAERRHGHDFGRVRVHSGPEANEATAAVGTPAYTLGRHVVLQDGVADPASADGRAVLAHELTHVVQQASFDDRELSGAPVLDAAHPSEREARAGTGEVTPLAAPAIQRAPGDLVPSTGSMLVDLVQARESQPVIMRQVLAEVNRKSREYLRGYNDGRANNPSAPGPLAAAALAEYDAGYSSGLAEATQAQKSLPAVTSVPETEPLLSALGARGSPREVSPQPDHPQATTTPAPSEPDAAQAESITKRRRELERAFVGNIARPMVGASSPDDFRITPKEIEKLRRRAESLRHVARAMQNNGLDVDASIMYHIIGDLLSDAKIAEVEWRQLSESAQSYWSMKRDHPEWQVQGNALLDITGSIVQESQSADVQFVMAIFVDAMVASPPRQGVSLDPETPRSGSPTPSAMSGDIDKAFADLEAGKIPQGDPAVRVPVRKGGEPAQVGDVGAGPKKVDLGLPPERELVAVERMDTSAAGSPDRILDASGAFPPELYGKYDALILNNPYAYAPNIAELSKGLTPNGKIILQGNWKANPFFRRAADPGGIPPGMTVTIERNVQPLGRGFSYTDPTRPGAPAVDSRITIEFKKH